MPNIHGQGPKRAILYAHASTDEQARSGYSWPNRSRPNYIEQLPAPGSIRGTQGQRRNDGSRCEG
jgi:hypothetical protein